MPFRPPPGHPRCTGSAVTSFGRRFLLFHARRTQERSRISAPTTNEPRINDRIRAREVRLVAADGTQLGIKPLPEALYIAREADLDLVEVAPQANPPVCRIMDYGKFKFDTAQRAKESKRKASNVAIKEMKYRLKIGPGDFETKTRQVARFLGEGHKVKITIMFRGREVDRPAYGKAILDRIAEQVVPLGKVEAFPKLDGRNMIMVLAPDKRAQAAAAKSQSGDDADGQVAGGQDQPAQDSSAQGQPVQSQPAQGQASRPAPNGSSPGQTHAPAPAAPPAPAFATTPAQAPAPAAAPAPAPAPGATPAQAPRPPQPPGGRPGVPGPPGPGARPTGAPAPAAPPPAAPAAPTPVPEA